MYQGKPLSGAGHFEAVPRQVSFEPKEGRMAYTLRAIRGRVLRAELRPADQHY
ncbi:MAG: hypothetical protein P9M14_18500 [Candidatus Alcyoniella australis]|nr:hypothetical protein [Candidatus Alcyoniella australis]